MHTFGSSTPASASGPRPRLRRPANSSSVRMCVCTRASPTRLGRSATLESHADGGIRTHDPRFTRAGIARVIFSRRRSRPRRPGAALRPTGGYAGSGPWPKPTKPAAASSRCPLSPRRQAMEQEACTGVRPGGSGWLANTRGRPPCDRQDPTRAARTRAPPRSRSPGRSHRSAARRLRSQVAVAIDLRRINPWPYAGES